MTACNQAGNFDGADFTPVGVSIGNQQPCEQLNCYALSAGENFFVLSVADSQLLTGVKITTDVGIVDVRQIRLSPLDSEGPTTRSGRRARAGVAAPVWHRLAGGCAHAPSAQGVAELAHPAPRTGACIRRWSPQALRDPSAIPKACLWVDRRALTPAIPPSISQQSPPGAGLCTVGR